MLERVRRKSGLGLLCHFVESPDGSMPFGPIVPGATTPGATSSDLKPGPMPPGASLLLPVAPIRFGLVAAGGKVGSTVMIPFRPGSLVAAPAAPDSANAAQSAADPSVRLFMIVSLAPDPSITNERAKGREGECSRFGEIERRSAGCIGAGACLNSSQVENEQPPGSPTSY
jgi:hypothetical protein